MLSLLSIAGGGEEDFIASSQPQDLTSSRIPVFFLGTVSKRLLFSENAADEHGSLFWRMVNLELLIGGESVITGDEWPDFISITRPDVIYPQVPSTDSGYKRSLYSIFNSVKNPLPQGPWNNVRCQEEIEPV